MFKVNHTHSEHASEDDDTDCEASEDSAYSQKSAMQLYLERIDELTQILNLDIVGCDAKWSVFASAALSYRWEELLQPLPPCYDDCIVEIDWLAKVINGTPKLKVLLKSILEEDYDACNRYVIEVLHSVLLMMTEQTFFTLDAHTFQGVIDVSGINMNGLLPTNIFEICFDIPSDQEIIFENMSSNFYKLLGFYGGPPSEFYSILTNGFLYNKNRVVDAEYVHLTTHLAESLTRSPPEPCWGASCCGAILRCVAVCEFINNPHYVAVHDDPNYENIDIYINDARIIRVRFMLFFREEHTSSTIDEELEEEHEIVDDNTIKKENKKKLLKLGCCVMSAAFIYWVYQRNNLGLKTFIEHKFNQLVQKLTNVFQRNLK